MLLIATLGLASCQSSDRENFKLCSERGEFFFTELLEEHGEFFDTDYVGDIKLCGDSRSCMMLPFQFSIPPTKLSSVENDLAWTDAGIEFSATKIKENTFSIQTFGKWGEETYEYSIKDGLLKRTIQVSPDESEVWNKCAGRLRFNDLEDIIKTTIKKKRLFKE